VSNHGRVSSLSCIVIIFVSDVSYNSLLQKYFVSDCF